MDQYKNIARILYVEDEDGVRRGFVKTLSRYAKEVYEASNGEEGLALYKEHLPDIVVTDIKMPKMNGIEMSKAIKEINPKQAIIVTTAHSESDYLLEAIRLQLHGYILKPIDKRVLKDKILEIVQAEEVKKEAQKNRFLMEEIANFQNNMLIVYDSKYKMLFANKLFLDFFTVDTTQEYIDKYKCMCNVFTQQSDFYSCTYNDDKHWTQEIEKLSDDKKIISMLDHTDMTTKTFLVNTKKVNSTNHKICTFSEITTITAKKKEYETKAFIDDLTKIYNRAKFNKALTQEIINNKINRNNLSLIFFDIDYFKRFNDDYGHQVGDDILVSFTSLIGSNIRDIDIFARWGGEEFVILLPNVDINAAIEIAESKRKLIEEHLFKNELKVTCSFGVTSINSDDDKDSFLKRADDALYRAKKSGRNCVMSS